jgi:hypothetical protein
MMNGEGTAHATYCKLDIFTKKGPFRGADNFPDIQENIRFYGPEDFRSARRACHSCQLSPVQRKKFCMQSRKQRI